MAALKSPPRRVRLARCVLRFCVVVPVFLALDSLWLSFSAQRLYRPAIGHLMRDGFSLGAAALFYLLYGFGMVYFVIAPSRNLRHTFARGASFGLIAYGTYDLTNQATLRGWPWRVTLADLVWGACVTAVSCAVAYRLMSRSSRD